MKSISIGIAGAGDLATKIMVALFELGHEVFTLPGSTKNFLEIAASLGVENYAERRQHLIDELDGVLLLSESAEFDQAAHLQTRIINFGIRGDVVADNRSGAIRWSATLHGVTEILCSENYHFNHHICGADYAVDVEQIALSMLIDVVSYVAQHNGAWPASIQQDEFFHFDSQEKLERIAFWHRSNQTAASIPDYRSLIDLFACAVERFPDRTAIIAPDATLTYRQLSDYAILIANDLLQQGVVCRTIGDAECVIGVALPKSTKLYASILAILGMGAAYVPLDPAYPKERLKGITEDSCLEYILTDVQYLPLFETCGTRAIHVPTYDDCKYRIVADAQFLIIHEAFNQSRLAVIIYTSGSTGRPKGVMLEHRNILSFCNWYQEHVMLTPESRALQFSTISFDASILDVFPTLACGACLIVPSEEQRHDFSALDRLVIEHQVTHAFLPPALLAALPNCSWPSLQHLVTGGDICDLDTIERWKPSRHFYNIYGPTECTVLATLSDFSVHDNNKNIGIPIANARCYLLDERMRPVKPGEHGELYIAGAGVGRGYYRQATMTSERFLPDPLDSNALVYRTGDMAMWNDDGNIHFVGRRDFQVKIRGFRVELGEIENAILRSRLFKQCAVVLDQQKRICAFVAKPYLDSSNAMDVKTAVRNILPEYMIPAQVIILPSLPATDNGKIDRKALLSIHVAQEVCLAQDDLTETETKLRTIWASVLGFDVAEIRKSDSFFDLGGYSLLVSRMLLLVRKEWSVNTPLARFMEQPTIESLALMLTDHSINKGDRIPAEVFSDMQLPLSIAPLAEKNAYLHSPREILLTGANGFLGVFLLQQLLKITEAIIYCLVRAPTEEDAYRKMQLALDSNGLSSLSGHPRLRVVLGDLEKPNLGMSEEWFAELAQCIDVIYHNGAHVNHIYDYRHLANTNVKSTLELLRLATTSQNKAIHFVSTLSAASNLNSIGNIVESGPTKTPPAFVNNGYNLSKWVSEHLVWQAIERGVVGTIIRPGNISGHSFSGVCQPEQNRIMLLIKGSIQLGCAPAWDSGFDLCPVDFLAEGAVRCSLSAVRETSVLHLHNPKPLNWIDFLTCLQEFGYRFDVVAPDVWRAAVVDIEESNALYNVLAFYLDDESEDIGDMSHIEFSKTERELQRVGMDYPEKSVALIQANLRYLIDCQFLPLPGTNVATKEIQEDISI